MFNFEGGCYAKVIRLSAQSEPEIYETTRRFGTILENVAFNSAEGRLNLDDDSLTENTRAAYPISHIHNATRDGLGGHPNHIIMLTADAFGVLPPIAKFTPAQAMYYFLSGYTAKVAGTEKGVTEPQATFSTCFGAPFMALSPTVYANLLGAKIARHKVDVWLVNTGWSSGPYGVGQRMKISYTRAMINAALNGELRDIPTTRDPNFGIAVPTSCPNVPAEVLSPRNTWADKAAYDTQARALASMFGGQIPCGEVWPVAKSSGHPQDPRLGHETNTGVVVQRPMHGAGGDAQRGCNIEEGSCVFTHFLAVARR